MYNYSTRFERLNFGGVKFGYHAPPRRCRSAERHHLGCYISMLLERLPALTIAQWFGTRKAIACPVLYPFTLSTG